MKIIHFLVDEKGLDIHSTCNKGNNIIHHLCAAVQDHLLPIIKKITSAYSAIKVNARNKDGYNALHRLLKWNTGEDLLECVNYYVDDLHIEVDTKTFEILRREKLPEPTKKEIWLILVKRAKRLEQVRIYYAMMSASTEITRAMLIHTN